MNQRPPLERLLDPTQCLEPTQFIDSDSVSLEALSHRVGGDGPPIQKAVRLFSHVRDEIQYEFRAKLAKDEYRASAPTYSETDMKRRGLLIGALFALAAAREALIGLGEDSTAFFA